MLVVKYQRESLEATAKASLPEDATFFLQVQRSMAEGLEMAIGKNQG